jgi:hypothetical protein
MTRKKEEDKDETKTKTTSTSSSSKKECLIDLVNQSTIPYWKMMMDLSRTGLDKQLEEEIRLKRLGEPIKPTITESEFNKKIKGE